VPTYDQQKHLEEKIYYWRFVIKALTQQGIEQIAQLNIDFESSSKIMGPFH
jgi:hypothetical protein